MEILPYINHHEALQQALLRGQAALLFTKIVTGIGRNQVWLPKTKCLFPSRLVYRLPVRGVIRLKLIILLKIVRFVDSPILNKLSGWNPSRGVKMKDRLMIDCMMHIIRSFFWFCSISVYKSQGENNSFRYLREKTLKSERPTSCDWHSNAKPWISPPCKRWKGKKERHLSEGNISTISTGTGTEEPAKKRTKYRPYKLLKKWVCESSSSFQSHNP